MKTPLIAMSESSEEIATPAAPQENPAPDPNYTFYLKMKPLRTLKRAIEALTNPTFSDDEFGMFGANTESLAITVKNDDNATATLLLKSPGMIEFQSCPSPPIVGLFAPLHLISQGFPRNLDGDDDTVTIFHVQGSDQLHFEFGTVPPTGIWAEIVVIPHVTMFPYCTVVSAAATVPIDDMKEQIDHTLQIQDPPSNDTGNKIGSDKKREYHYKLYSQHEVKEAKGFEQESTNDEVVFNWRYIRLMKEASSLSDRVSLHLLAHHALFQFHMGELADLLLIKKSVLVVPHMSAEEDAPDEDVSGSIPPDTVSIS